MIAGKKVVTRVCQSSENDVVQEAVLNIENGNTIVIPTDTIFGLTADATNSDAIKHLFEIKNRNINNVSAIYLADISQIKKYAVIEHDYVEKIIAKFLPGALTIVLKSRIKDWHGVVSEEGKIGIRICKNQFLESLLQKLDRPLLATSANISNNKDIDNVVGLKEQFEGLVPLIVYDKEKIVTDSSTVVDLSSEQPIFLREGMIPFKRIEELLGEG